MPEDNAIAELNLTTQRPLLKLLSLAGYALITVGLFIQFGAIEHALDFVIAVFAHWQITLGWLLSLVIVKLLLDAFMPKREVTWCGVGNGWLAFCDPMLPSRCERFKVKDIDQIRIAKKGWLSGWDIFIFLYSGKYAKERADKRKDLTRLIEFLRVELPTVDMRVLPSKLIALPEPAGDTQPAEAAESAAETSAAETSAAETRTDAIMTGTAAATTAATLAYDGDDTATPAVAAGLERGGEVEQGATEMTTGQLGPELEGTSEVEHAATSQAKAETDIGELAPEQREAEATATLSTSSDEDDNAAIEGAALEAKKTDDEVLAAPAPAADGDEATSAPATIQPELDEVSADPAPAEASTTAAPQAGEPAIEAEAETEQNEELSPTPTSPQSPPDGDAAADEATHTTDAAMPAAAEADSPAAEPSPASATETAGDASLTTAEDNGPAAVNTPSETAPEEPSEPWWTRARQTRRGRR